MMSDRKKKRGRPRKSVQKNNEQKINIEHEREMILHLNIHTKDLNDESLQKEDDQYNFSDSNNESEDKNIFTSTKDNVKENTKDKNYVTFTEMSETKNVQTPQTKFYASQKIFSYGIELNLIKQNIIQKNTEISCWWCTYSFSTTPIFIPEKNINDTYYVFGCFCSCNCAISYNLSMNDYKLWERHSLMIKLYTILLHKSILGKAAPPKELLKKYGGQLTIEEFRNNFDDALIDYTLYPITLIEYAVKINEYHKINYSQEQTQYKLRRTKPLKINTVPIN